tara:strand:- start:43547 stop:44227 length:681 start_codon:yes stop_codon:yes gene_type:complete
VGASTKSESLFVTISAYPNRLSLRAEHLACQRGGRMVFRDVSFALAGGAAMVVTGANGAGKSSLLRLIGGLLDPAGGKLVLEGGAEDFSLPEQTHYVGHADALKGAMSVMETARFWADFLGGTADRIAHAFDVFDLAHLAELPVAYLSAGQRRRLVLARLLIAPRALWLLDEPSVALDTASLSRLVVAMQDHLVLGGMIIAATHQNLGLQPVTNLSMGTARVQVPV